MAHKEEGNDPRRGLLAGAAGGRFKLKNMSKYYLFYGTEYYPRGGMWDFRGAFPTVAAANKALKSKEYPPDWYHIVAADTMEVVEANGDSYLGRVDFFEEEIEKNKDKL